ncbi:hypothetical protein HanHA300_Chr13g0484171 [Helianthus annuus]|nr:hypothetical protein HanHA300_Chr13g0484171 [Helianthus annuus]KAJ0663890.1 hypothetical protein HanLR1_Chr13g0486041 [Helianthus annuus]
MPLFLLVLLALVASTSASPPIHDVLKVFGFPPGLLPDSVQSYILCPLEEGFNFTIYLKYTPITTFRFMKEITGHINIFNITQLNGLQMATLDESFEPFWINIVDIKVSDQRIYFTLEEFSLLSFKSKRWRQFQPAKIWPLMLQIDHPNLSLSFRSA